MLSSHRTALSSISLFLLLDLLGSSEPWPQVPSYFKATHWAYCHLAKVEERLRSLSILLSDPPQPFLPDTDKSLNAFRSFMIEDDHVPFLARGVPILHVIPTPFPRVWHTMDDNGEHLNLKAVADWATITTAFVAEWMDLEGFLNAIESSGADGPSRKTEL